MTLILTLLLIIGYTYAAHRLLKIKLSYAPIFSVSLIGICLFVFAVNQDLKIGTWLMIFLGFLFFIIGGLDRFINKDKYDFSWLVQFLIILSVIIFISFFITRDMAFTIVDDYVFWGIIGKYLFMFDHLPDTETTIISKHLSYTPGASLIHYLFYTLSGDYQSATSYFAQDILFASALCVVLKRNHPMRSVSLCCLLIVLFTLFCGSVFIKLQVDYLLSAYFLAVLWIYFNEKPSFLTMITISTPVCFLFLIKEIGIFLGFSLIALILIDIFLFKGIERKQKISIISAIVITGAGLIFLKSVWTAHCQSMGFLKFSNAINVDSIINSFKIFSDQGVQKGFAAFIKGVFLAPADRLNLPYILWYTALAFFWVKIFKNQGVEEKKRYKRLMAGLGICFLIYLIMNYFLQIIVFGVGVHQRETIGLTRYLNILAVQIIIFTILLYVQETVFKGKMSRKAVISFVIVICLVLTASRVETTLNREKHYSESKKIAVKIASSIPEKVNKICIIPGTNDHHLWIQLLYHLLPNKISHSGFPVENKKIFAENLKKYDYVYFNRPNQRILAWVEPMVSKPFEDYGFFKIEFANNALGNKGITLNRLF